MRAAHPDLPVAGLFAAVNISGVRRSIGLLGGLTLLKARAAVHRRGRGDRADLPVAGARAAAAAERIRSRPADRLLRLRRLREAVVPAGETSNPERRPAARDLHHHRRTTLLYFLVQLAFVSALPGRREPTRRRR